MRILAATLIGCTLCTAVQAQVPELRPASVNAPVDLSPQHRARFDRYLGVLEGTIRPLPGERAMFDSMYVTYGEVWESPCDVVGLGCSWYCGGGPDTVWASSTLPSQGDHRYDAWNAHDLDRCTAWSEAIPGPGLGERLTYRFAPDSPRLHTVIVSNGLVTDSSAWRANNRVARLRVAANGTALYDLLLEDTMGDQQFKLPELLGRRADGSPLLLTFTIIAVYPGDRFDDTVISELWFDGTDVH
jgi:hypothetical protein